MALKVNSKNCEPEAQTVKIYTADTRTTDAQTTEDSPKDEITPLMRWVMDKWAEVLGCESDENGELINTEDKISLAVLDGIYIAEMVRTGMSKEEIEDIVSCWD